MAGRGRAGTVGGGAVNLLERVYWSCVLAVLGGTLLGIAWAIWTWGL